MRSDVKKAMRRLINDEKVNLICDKVWREKRIYRRAIPMLLAVVFMMVLSGCSLAKEDAGEEEQVNSDRLVGAFITTEYLHLFDMEAYINDNIDKMTDGGTVTAANNSKYNGRLYATIDKKDSTEPSDWEVTFGDLEGICFFAARWQQGEDEPFTMLTMGDGICDVTQHLLSTDEGESIALIGKMYALVGETTDSISFYVNPVYQTESGEIYVTSGMGHSIEGEVCGSSTIKLEEESTVTENKKSETYGGAVELTIEILKAAPVKLRIHYMDNSLELLHTEEYAAGEVPFSLEAVEGTACVVVETEWTDGEITREIYEPEDGESTYIEVFYTISDVALGKQSSEIIWK